MVNASALGRVIWKIVFVSEDGGNIDQNEPLRLGPMSFASKLLESRYKMSKMSPKYSLQYIP